MRLREKRVADYAEEGVVLEYVDFTKEFREVKNYVLQKGETITVYAEGNEAVSVRIEDILYFEAVGEFVFAYLENRLYEVKLRLYQVEEKLKSKSILRVSKSVLLNLDYIVSVRPALNGRLYARMENGEDILISRKYAKQISERIMEDEYEGI